MPDELDEAERKRKRMRSIQVLNQEVGNLRGDVSRLHSKFDEFLLLTATLAGSVKLGARALVVVAGVVAVGSVVMALLCLKNWSAVGTVLGSLIKAVLH